MQHELDLIADAIRRRRHLIILYGLQDGPRLVCPHVLGFQELTSGERDYLLLAYQYGGQTGRALGPLGSAENWRILRVAACWQVEAFACERWFTAEGCEEGLIPPPDVFDRVEVLAGLPSAP